MILFQVDGTSGGGGGRRPTVDANASNVRTQNNPTQANPNPAAPQSPRTQNPAASGVLQQAGQQLGQMRHGASAEMRPMSPQEFTQGLVQAQSPLQRSEFLKGLPKQIPGQAPAGSIRELFQRLRAAHNPTDAQAVLRQIRQRIESQLPRAGINDRVRLAHLSALNDFENLYVRGQEPLQEAWTRLEHAVQWSDAHELESRVEIRGHQRVDQLWEAHNLYRTTGEAGAANRVLNQLIQELRNHQSNSPLAQLSEGDRHAILVRAIEAKIEMRQTENLASSMGDLERCIHESYGEGHGSLESRWEAHALLVEYTRLYRAIHQTMGPAVTNGLMLTNSISMDTHRPANNPLPEWMDLSRMTNTLESETSHEGNLLSRTAHYFQLARAHSVMGDEIGTISSIGQAEDLLRQNNQPSELIRALIIQQYSDLGLSQHLPSRVEGWMQADEQRLTHANPQQRFEVLSHWTSLASALYEIHQDATAHQVVQNIQSHLGRYTLAAQASLYNQLLTNLSSSGHPIPDQLRNDILSAVRQGLQNPHATWRDHMAIREVLIRQSGDAAEIAASVQDLRSIVQSQGLSSSEGLQLRNLVVRGLLRQRELTHENGFGPLTVGPQGLRTALAEYRMALTLAREGLQYSRLTPEARERSLREINGHYQELMELTPQAGQGFVYDDVQERLSISQGVIPDRHLSPDQAQTLYDDYRDFLGSLPVSERLGSLRNMMGAFIQRSEDTLIKNELLPMYREILRGLPAQERLQAMVSLTPILSEERNRLDVAIERARPHYDNQHSEERDHLIQLRQEIVNLESSMWMELRDAADSPAATRAFCNGMVEVVHGHSESARARFQEILRNGDFRNSHDPQTEGVLRLAFAAIGGDVQDRSSRILELVDGLANARQATWLQEGHTGEQAAIQRMRAELPRFLSTLPYDQLPATFEEALNKFAAVDSEHRRWVDEFGGALSRLPLQHEGRNGVRDGSVWNLIRAMDHLENSNDVRNALTALRGVLRDDVSWDVLSHEGRGDLGSALQDVASMLMQRVPTGEDSLRREILALRNEIPESEEWGTWTRETFNARTAMEVALMAAAGYGATFVAEAAMAEMFAGGVELTEGLTAEMVMTQRSSTLAARAALQRAGVAAGDAELEGMLAQTLGARIGNRAVYHALRNAIHSTAFNVYNSQSGLMFGQGGHGIGRASADMAIDTALNDAIFGQMLQLLPVPRSMLRQVVAGLFRHAMSNTTFLFAQNIRHLTTQAAFETFSSHYQELQQEHAHLMALYNQTGNASYLEHAQAIETEIRESVGEVDNSLRGWLGNYVRFVGQELAERQMGIHAHAPVGEDPAEVETRRNQRVDQELNRRFDREADRHLEYPSVRDPIEVAAHERFAEGTEAHQRLRERASQEIEREMVAEPEVSSSGPYRGMDRESVRARRIEERLRLLTETERNAYRRERLEAERERFVAQHPDRNNQAIFFHNLADQGVFERFTPSQVDAVLNHADQIHPPVERGTTSVRGQANQNYVIHLFEHLNSENFSRHFLNPQAALRSAQAAADLLHRPSAAGERSRENSRIFDHLIQHAAPEFLREPERFVESVRQAREVLNNPNIRSQYPQLNNDQILMILISASLPSAGSEASRRFESPVELARGLAEGRIHLHDQTPAEMRPLTAQMFRDGNELSALPFFKVERASEVVRRAQPRTRRDSITRNEMNVAAAGNVSPSLTSNVHFGMNSPRPPSEGLAPHEVRQSGANTGEEARTEQEREALGFEAGGVQADAQGQGGRGGEGSEGREQRGEEDTNTPQLVNAPGTRPGSDARHQPRAEGMGEIPGAEREVAEAVSREKREASLPLVQEQAFAGHVNEGEVRIERSEPEILHASRDNLQSREVPTRAPIYRDRPTAASVLEESSVDSLRASAGRRSLVRRLLDSRKEARAQQLSVSLERLQSENIQDREQVVFNFKNVVPHLQGQQRWIAFVALFEAMESLGYYHRQMAVHSCMELLVKMSRERVQEAATLLLNEIENPRSREMIPSCIRMLGNVLLNEQLPAQQRREHTRVLIGFAGSELAAHARMAIAALGDAFARLPATQQREVRQIISDLRNHSYELIAEKARAAWNLITGEAPQVDASTPRAFIEGHNVGHASPHMMDDPTMRGEVRSNEERFWDRLEGRSGLASVDSGNRDGGGGSLTITERARNAEPAALPGLIRELLNSNEPDARHEAGQLRENLLRGQVNGQRVPPEVFREAALGFEGEVCGNLLIIIRLIGEKLEDSDPAMQIAAARVVKELGFSDSGYRAALERVIRETSHEEVRQAAQEALDTINAHEAQKTNQNSTAELATYPGEAITPEARAEWMAQLVQDTVFETTGIRRFLLPVLAPLVFALLARGVASQQIGRVLERLGIRVRRESSHSAQARREEAARQADEATRLPGRRERPDLSPEVFRAGPIDPVRMREELHARLNPAQEISRDEYCAELGSDLGIDPGSIHAESIRDAVARAILEDNEQIAMELAHSSVSSVLKRVINAAGFKNGSPRLAAVLVSQILDHASTPREANELVQRYLRFAEAVAREGREALDERGRLLPEPLRFAEREEIFESLFESPVTAREAVERIRARNAARDEHIAEGVRTAQEINAASRGNPIKTAARAEIETALRENDFRRFGDLAQAHPELITSHDVRALRGTIYSENANRAAAAYALIEMIEREGRSPEHRRLGETARDVFAGADARMASLVRDAASGNTHNANIRQQGGNVLSHNPYDLSLRVSAHCEAVAQALIVEAMNSPSDVALHYLIQRASEGDANARTLLQHAVFPRRAENNPKGSRRVLEAVRQRGNPDLILAAEYSSRSGYVEAGHDVTGTVGDRVRVDTPEQARVREAEEARDAQARREAGEDAVGAGYPRPGAETVPLRARRRGNGNEGFASPETMALAALGMLGVSVAPRLMTLMAQGLPSLQSLFVIGGLSLMALGLGAIRSHTRPEQKSSRPAVNPSVRVNQTPRWPAGVPDNAYLSHVVRIFEPYLRAAHGQAPAFQNDMQRMIHFTQLPENIRTRLRELAGCLHEAPRVIESVLHEEYQRTVAEPEFVNLETILERTLARVKQVLGQERETRSEHQALLNRAGVHSDEPSAAQLYTLFSQARNSPEISEHPHFESLVERLVARARSEMRQDVDRERGTSLERGLNGFLRANERDESGLRVERNVAAPVEVANLPPQETASERVPRVRENRLREIRRNPRVQALLNTAGQEASRHLNERVRNGRYASVDQAIQFLEAEIDRSNPVVTFGRSSVTAEEVAQRDIRARQRDDNSRIEIIARGESEVSPRAIADYEVADVHASAANLPQAAHTAQNPLDPAPARGPRMPAFRPGGTYISREGPEHRDETGGIPDPSARFTEPLADMRRPEEHRNVHSSQNSRENFVWAFDLEQRYSGTRLPSPQRVGVESERRWRAEAVVASQAWVDAYRQATSNRSVPDSRVIPAGMFFAISHATVVEAVHDLIRGKGGRIENLTFLHSGEHIKYFRPAHAGEILNVEIEMLGQGNNVNIENGIPNNRSVLKVKRIFRNAAGEILAECISTFQFRSHDQIFSNPMRAFPSAASQREMGAVNLEQINRFSEVSGDHQWLHDASAVRARGVNNPYLHGMATFNMAESRIPGEIHFPFEVNMSFSQPVVLGDQVHLERDASGAHVVRVSGVARPVGRIIRNSLASPELAQAAHTAQNLLDPAPATGPRMPGFKPGGTYISSEAHEAGAPRETGALPDPSARFTEPLRDAQRPGESGVLGEDAVRVSRSPEVAAWHASTLDPILRSNESLGTKARNIAHAITSLSEPTREQCLEAVAVIRSLSGLDANARVSALTDIMMQESVPLEVIHEFLREVDNDSRLSARTYAEAHYMIQINHPPYRRHQVMGIYNEYRSTFAGEPEVMRALDEWERSEPRIGNLYIHLINTLVRQELRRQGLPDDISWLENRTGFHMFESYPTGRVSVEVLRGLTRAMVESRKVARYTNRDPLMPFLHVPARDYVHLFLGRRPSLESALRTVAENLRATPLVLGSSMGPVFQNETRLQTQMVGSEGPIYLQLARGRYEYNTGLEMTLTGTDDPHRPNSFFAKTGINFRVQEDGSLVFQVVNLQGPYHDEKAPHPMEHEARQALLGDANVTRLLMANILLLAENMRARGIPVARIEMVHEDAQMGYQDLMMTRPPQAGQRRMSPYAEASRRFGFREDRTHSDYSHLDFSNLSRDEVFRMINEALGDETAEAFWNTVAPALEQVGVVKKGTSGPAISARRPFQSDATGSLHEEGTAALRNSRMQAQAETRRRSEERNTRNVEQAQASALRNRNWLLAHPNTNTYRTLVALGRVQNPDSHTAHDFHQFVEARLRAEGYAVERRGENEDCELHISRGGEEAVVRRRFASEDSFERMTWISSRGNPDLIESFLGVEAEFARGRRMYVDANFTRHPRERSGFERHYPGSVTGLARERAFALAGTPLEQRGERPVQQVQRQNRISLEADLPMAASISHPLDPFGSSVLDFSAADLAVEAATNVVTTSPTTPRIPRRAGMFAAGALVLLGAIARLSDAFSANDLSHTPQQASVESATSYTRSSSTSDATTVQSLSFTNDQQHVLTLGRRDIAQVAVNASGVIQVKDQGPFRTWIQRAQQRHFDRPQPGVECELHEGDVLVLGTSPQDGSAQRFEVHRVDGNWSLVRISPNTSPVSRTETTRSPSHRH